MKLVSIALSGPRTKIFDETDYWPPLRRNLGAARGRILVHVPYITQKGLDRWMPELMAALKRGVQVYVILAQPEDWDKREDPLLDARVRTRLDTQTALINWLKSAGVQVILRKGIHAKFVIIDEDILWEGSLNFLSHYGTREHVRCSVTREEVAEVKRRHDMNDLPGGKEPNTEKLLGSAIINRRQERGLSQTELAHQIGMPRATLSRIESGKLAPLQPAFKKVMDAVDLRVIVVPDYLRARVEAFVEQLCQEQKTTSPKQKV
jgi:DNA-binding XRE family transcriptional regulator